MPWRKWFVRTLVFSIIGAFGVAALAYYRWTDPAKVRELVIAKLEEMYPGAVITVDSAHLRLLGGIQVNELRMSRRDDPDRTEFFHVPSAIFYHDKEKILDGMITLRKVELHRARFRLARLRDGKWNVQDIQGERRSDALLPTVVLHHGTILVEDQQAGPSAPPLELHDVNLSFINDPLKLVVVKGSATSPGLGALALSGSLHRDTKEIDLKLRARGAVIDQDLLRRLPFTCHCFTDVTLQAKVDLDASLDYRPGQPNPLDYRINVDISDGKLRHPQLPLALEAIRTRLECINGMIELSDFEARSGTAELKGKASAQLPCPEQAFEAELEIKHLTLDESLARRLPSSVYFLQQLFQASGQTTVKIACARRDGEWVNLSGGRGQSSHVAVLPENGRVCFKYFKYPIENLTGEIDWFPQTRAVDVNVSGGPRDRPPLQIVGFWHGYGAQARASFEISASEVPIEGKLVDALPEHLQKLTNSFHPSGKIDFTAHLKREAGSEDFRNEYHLVLRDGTVCWRDFPYLLKKVRGLLDIYPGHWEFREGYGTHEGGELRIQGRSLPGDPQRHIDDGLELQMAGKDVALDDDMQRALATMPQLAKTWDSFRPRGRIRFGANIEVPPGRPQDMDVVVDVAGAAVEPVFFSYLLSDISGRFRFHRNRLEARRVRAHHGDARLAMELGTVDLQPGGGHYTKLNDLRVLHLSTEPELLKALPKTMRSFISSLQLTKPVDIRTLLVIRQDSEPNSLPDVGWDGLMMVKDSDLSAGVTWNNVDGVIACRGRHDGSVLRGLRGNFMLDRAVTFKQKFTKAYGEFEVKENFPDILNIGVRAPIFGGDLTGQARIELTSAMRYEIILDASNIDLRKFGDYNLGSGSQLNGKMDGRVHLWGLGSDANTLDGNGQIDVDHGRLYNLPLLLDLIKFLGLRWPDRTAFEEMHALFSIHGRRATVRRLNLTGNAVSLTGKGDFNLDGTGMNLDFYPSWGHFETGWGGIFKPITSAISKNILIIEVRGQVDGNPDHVKFNKRFVPMVADQLRDLRQWIGPEK